MRKINGRTRNKLSVSPPSILPQLLFYHKKYSRVVLDKWLFSPRHSVCFSHSITTCRRMFYNKLCTPCATYKVMVTRKFNPVKLGNGLVKVLGLKFMISVIQLKIAAHKTRNASSSSYCQPISQTFSIIKAKNVVSILLPYNLRSCEKDNGKYI